MRRLLVLLALGVPLIAQQPGRADIFGLIGLGKVYDDEGSLGSGVNLGGGIGYRLRKRLGVEAEVNAFRSERDFGAFPPPFRFSGFQVMGNALSHFGPPRAQFYILGGLGVMGVRNRNRDVADTQFGIGFGVGMKIFASEHIYIRPDLRIFGRGGSNLVGDPITVLRVGIGAGYSW
jgi:hypothetical protein